MSANWIEIARTGTFADSMGRPQTFTARDLEAIAGAYDPHKRDAPLVFGHPESDAAPAFGWVERLKSEGGKLLATFADVPQEVRELVAKGHYRHVSMSLMPDRTTLRHVALLGAAQPAIDGLKAVSFAADEGAITIEFAATGGEGDTTMTIEELQRQVGQLQAQLESLTTENKSLKKQLSESETAKTSAETARAEAEKKAEKVSADFAAYRDKIETERREARVSALVKAGKLKPAEKADTLAFAAALAAQDGSVDFAAPDGSGGSKTEKISLEERYFRELEARSVDGRFMEFTAPPRHAEGQDKQTWTPDEVASKL